MMHNSYVSWLVITVTASVVAALAALPAVLQTYPLTLMTQILIYGIFAMSLNILVGYIGLPSLGHASYFGAAAYTVAILTTKYAITFWGTLAAAIILTTVLSAIFGLLALRARGVYFLMITLALSMVIWGLANRIALTNGDSGISGIPTPDLNLPWSFADTGVFYYLSLIAFLAVFALILLIVRSPFGKGLQGIRENEERMASLGYHVWLHIFLAFIIAAALAGIAGTLWGYYNRFVSPIDVGFVPSVEAFLMVALGGSGTVAGPVLGAAVLIFVKNFVALYTQRWLLVIGGLYIILVLLRPGGILRASSRAQVRQIGKTKKRYIIKARTTQGNGEQCPALTLHSVSKTFGGLHAIDAVDLRVPAGSRHAFIGPNGAGKTTLFNLIAGELSPSIGRIFLFGHDVTGLPNYRRAALGLARTYQITKLFRSLTVLDNVLLAVQALDSAKFTMIKPLLTYCHFYERAQQVLEKVGLGGKENVMVRNLSYGEQRQLEIALALAGEPQILLLDEPMAGLSHAESHTISEMLKNLDQAITLLIIEHDMDVAFALADRITVLHSGRVIADGTVEEVRQNKLVQNVYLGSQVEEACQPEIKPREGQVISTTGLPILDVEDIHTYYADSYILQGVSLNVSRGQIVAILGRNGMGKTTLIRSIIGLTPPRKGEVRFNGKDITGRPPFEAVKLGMALVPQGRHIFPSLTVAENLAVAEYPRCKWTLEGVGELFPRLQERIYQRGSSLSGGEQQMLAIARALMTNPLLLLMDEPTEGLSPKLVKELARAFERFKEAGLSVLLVEQNLSFALQVAEKVHIILKGQIVHSGFPQEIWNDKEIKSRYLGL